MYLRKQGREQQKGDGTSVSEVKRRREDSTMNPIESLVSISSYTELQSYRDRAYTCPTPSLKSAAFSLASTSSSHEKHQGPLLEPPKEEHEVGEVVETVIVTPKPQFLPQVIMEKVDQCNELSVRC